jgi:hypothetical protein
MEKLFSILLWQWAGILAEAQPASVVPPSRVAHSAQLANVAGQSSRQVRTRSANSIARIRPDRTQIRPEYEFIPTNLVRLN